MLYFISNYAIFHIIIIIYFIITSFSVLYFQTIFFYIIFNIEQDTVLILFSFFNYFEIRKYHLICEMSEQHRVFAISLSRSANQSEMGTGCLETFALNRDKGVSSLEDISEASILSIGQLEMEGAIVFAFGSHSALLHSRFLLPGFFSRLRLEGGKVETARNQLWNFSNLSVILRFLLCPGSS